MPRVRRRRRSAPRRILIVDDNQDHVVSLAALLEAMGHEVRAEYDGGAALDAVADYRPHAVILDIGLPVLDGYEVARCLRAAYPDRSLRLIALTGYGQARDSQHAREAGFDSFMIKPPDIRALNTLLSTDKRAKTLKTL
jgi:CheY-like chemotaxis protein